jgi:hypothetical protein
MEKLTLANLNNFSSSGRQWAVAVAVAVAVGNIESKKEMAK